VAARGWAGVVLSLFPVQTLGELGLGRGEVISCSNCKVDCKGKGVVVVCCSFSVYSPKLGYYDCPGPDQGLHFKTVYFTIVPSFRCNFFFSMNSIIALRQKSDIFGNMFIYLLAVSYFPISMFNKV